MSEVTRILHRKNYASIDAARPEQSQAGRKFLITGSCGGLGLHMARAFVTAGADIVVVTSRSMEKAERTAKELEAGGKGRTKVHGYQYQINDEKSVQGLWDAVAKDGFQIDVLIMCATESVPKVSTCTPSVATAFKAFESNVHNQLLNADRFIQQGPKMDNELAPENAPSTASRMAMTRLMQDLAAATPAEEMRIHNIHPGFVLTEIGREWGLKDNDFPYDDASLVANFMVWVATEKAAFLHGRFLWANWDVDELIAMKPKFESDKGFLKVGLQGVTSQDFGLLVAGMQRSI
ncbi:hypothetical protein B0H19DRAFT_1211642 [Mycena capillaripes]|nr:hypothetical protein B0H19DRAFT_1211642 [Mycena capillaripes]